MIKKVILSLTIIVICDYVRTESDTRCDQTYIRVKRGKYYSGPPQRFYNRPPVNYPIRGAFSYTPPPFMSDEGPHYPGPGLGPYKVSKRPTNEGLGDEDLNNLMKHLTKQDLDKIIEFAYEKEKNYEYSKPPTESYNKIVYKEPEDAKFSYQEPSIPKPHEVEFNKYINYVTESVPTKKYTSEDIRPFSNVPKAYQITDLHNDDRLKSHSYPPTNVNFPIKYPVAGNPYFVDSDEEVRLPKPVNMRDDFEVSYTNNVPTIVKAESTSYKLEDVSNLPLMTIYDSKLDSVSSYQVPHYTVTTHQKPQQSPLAPSSSSSLVPSPAAASIKAPPLEPAPPISAAKEQSDAHLKATKIWSHRSKGTAYTLHDDGTLTLERPSRPKYG